MVAWLRAIAKTQENLANLSLSLFLLIAKILGLQKHTTAEELHKLVLAKKIVYEDIRKIDPVKFVDLEATMRMLYDHGNMTFEGPPQSISSILPTNASMREPKRQSNVNRNL